MRLWPVVTTGLVLVAMVLVAGCGAKDTGGAVGAPNVSGRTGTTTPPGALHAQLPPPIATVGVLRVGTAVAPPLASVVGSSPSGLEPDLASALGRVLGIAVTFVAMPPVSLAGAVRGRQVDLAMGGLADTSRTRSTGLEFVDVLAASSSLLVRRANPGRAGSVDDLCGRAVGVVAGTPAEAAVERRQAACTGHGRPAIAVDPVAGHDALVALLSSDRNAVAVEDTLVASYAAQSSVAPVELQTLGPPFDPVLEGMAVPASSPGLRDALVAALRTVITEGTYAGILERWGAGGQILPAATVDGGA